uniref:Uncharacterized protein n=1 Tax=Pan troglodytes TaxID=9598 RepID=A0A2I3S6A1_PANTR
MPDHAAGDAGRKAEREASEDSPGSGRDRPPSPPVSRLRSRTKPSRGRQGIPPELQRRGPLLLPKTKWAGGSAAEGSPRRSPSPGAAQVPALPRGEPSGGAAAGSFWKPLHQHSCGLRPPPPGRFYTRSARWGYAGRGSRRRGCGGAAEPPPPPWPGARSPAAFSLPDRWAGARAREMEPGAERVSASGAEAGG